MVLFRSIKTKLARNCSSISKSKLLVSEEVFHALQTSQKVVALESAGTFYLPNS